MMEGGMQLLNRDGHSISHNSKRHYHDSFVSMNRMRQRGLLCDIVLHVSNKEIKAHKVVLASCSPYFHAMFTSEFTPLFPSCYLSPVFLSGRFCIPRKHLHILPVPKLPSRLPVWDAGGRTRCVRAAFPLQAQLQFCLPIASRCSCCGFDSDSGLHLIWSFSDEAVLVCSSNQKAPYCSVLSRLRF